jgi:hypothetical protein
LRPASQAMLYKMLKLSHHPRRDEEAEEEGYRAAEALWR